MRGTCRLHRLSLGVHTHGRGTRRPHSPQTPAELRLISGHTERAARAQAQRTFTRAAATAIALLCAISVLAAEPWSRDARAFHAEGFAEGVTTQSLAGGGLTPDPLAPDAGTVAYIIHTKGQAWAAVVVYDPTTRRYRHVCGLVGPFETANDLHTFDPLLRSLLAAVHERGFPARVVDYTPDIRTVDLAQFEEVAPPRVRTQPTETPQPIAAIPVALPPPAPQPLTAQQTLVLLAVGLAGVVLLALSVALLLHLFFRHREQMAVVRTATRPAQAMPTLPAPATATHPAQPTPTRKAPPTPRPTAVPTPTPVAKQGP